MSLEPNKHIDNFNAEHLPKNVKKANPVLSKSVVKRLNVQMSPMTNWRSAFEQIWGEAPEGTPKYERGQQIIKLIEQVEAGVYERCIGIVKDLERQWRLIEEPSSVFEAIDIVAALEAASKDKGGVR